MCQIGAFRPLRRDCARLRDRRMACIVSKGRADFSTLTADCARLWGHRILERVFFQLLCPIEKRRVGVLTLFLRFDDLSAFWHYPRHSTISQSRAISSQRPKFAKLARAGANAFEPVGYRRVNVMLPFKCKCDLRGDSDADAALVLRVVTFLLRLLPTQNHSRSAGFTKGWDWIHPMSGGFL